MSDQYWDYVARHPRHDASDPKRITVEIERLSQNCQQTIPATLVDLSRRGVQVVIGEEVKVAESVRVRILDAQSGFDYQLTAAVRWCRAAEDSTSSQWAVGCQFDAEADWEIIGELLLSGVLSMG